MLRNISWRYFDFWLLGVVVLATAFGTTMIRSAVAENEVLLPLIERQIYFAVAGLGLIFLVATIDYRYWMALYRPIVFMMSALLFALFLSAQAVFGAARWFSVGVLFLQPTEFAKIAAILLLTPRAVTLGALLSLGTISGAILAHLTRLGIAIEPVNDRGELFALALIVFFGSATILFIRRRAIPIVGDRLFGRSAG